MTCLLFAIVKAAKMDDRFVLEHPLSNSKFKKLLTIFTGTFNHWKASGSAVFLETRTILTPEAKDQKGLIYAKHTFNLQNFELEIDLSIHNKLSSTFSLGDFRFYLLRDNPMKSAFEFSQGLDDLYDGLQVHIKENSLRNT